MLEVNRIYNMDCLEGMKMLDDESIHLLVTSPPYYNARDYIQYGSIDDYKETMKSIFTEAYRVMGNHRYIIVNVGDVTVSVDGNPRRTRKLALGAWFTIMLQEIGFIYIDDYIWDKGEPQSKRNMGNPPYPYYQYPVNCYEHILVFVKHRDDRSRIVCPLCGSDKVTSNGYAGIGVYSFECKNPECNRSEHGRGKRFSALTVMRDGYKTEENLIDEDILKRFRRDIVKITPVIKINNKGDNKLGHTAPFPSAIPDMAVRFFSGQGDIVLDPFMGSGTTALVCLEDKRRYIGFELNPDYCDVIGKRVEEFNANERNKLF